MTILVTVVVVGVDSTYTGMTGRNLSYAGHRFRSDYPDPLETRLFQSDNGQHFEVCFTNQARQAHVFEIAWVIYKWDDDRPMRPGNMNKWGIPVRRETQSELIPPQKQSCIAYQPGILSIYGPGKYRLDVSKSTLFSSPALGTVRTQNGYDSIEFDLE
jgi:hypothetical protein